MLWKENKFCIGVLNLQLLVVRDNYWYDRFHAPGEVAEWSNALGLKPSVAVMSPWVQIPPSPFLGNCLIFGRSQLGQTHLISIDSRKGQELIAQTPLHSNNSNCWNYLRVPRLTHQRG